MAIKGFAIPAADLSNKRGAMYSLPIKATPESEAAFEIRIIQFIAKAMDG